MKKHILTAAAILALCFLAGCSKTPSLTTDEASSSGAQTEASSTFSAASAAPQPEPAPTESAAQEPEAQPGRISLYGERHADDMCLEKELKIWGEFYAQGDRHMFIEFPCYTADYLNRWMQEDSDDILNQLYQDWAGTPSHSPNILAFFKQLKEAFPETVFHGNDVGHSYWSTGMRYLAELEAAGQENSDAYIQAQKACEQGRQYYSMEQDEEGGGARYRESCLVENFILEYEKIAGTNVMGIYGNAHVDLEGRFYYLYSRNLDSMAKQLSARYGDALHTDILTFVDAIRTDKLLVGDKEYEASYFGEEDLLNYGLPYQKREFWRLENAYEDFASYPLLDEVLPYHNYPMRVEKGQVFVIDYTRLDGSIERAYYRSDGTTWNNAPTTQRFSVDE